MTRFQAGMVLAALGLAGCSYSLAPLPPTSSTPAASKATPNSSATPRPGASAIASSPGPGASATPTPAAASPTPSPSVVPTGTPSPGHLAVQLGGATTGVWQEVSPLSRARLGPVAAVLGGMLAVVGGDGQEVFESYQPAVDHWSLLDFGDQFTGNQRSGFGPYFAVGGVVGGDHLVVAGGSNGSPVSVGTRIYTQLVSTVHIQLGPTMPTPRYAAAGGALGTMVYVAGGRTLDGTISGALEAYDVSASSWSSLPAMPVPVAGAAAAVVTDGLVVLGGYGANGAAVNSVQVYRPSAGTWSTTAYPALRTARHSAAAAFLGGELYLFGGVVGGQTVASCERLDVASATWQSMPGLLAPRALHAAVVLGTSLYVLGGQDAGGLATRTVEGYMP